MPDNIHDMRPGEDQPGDQKEGQNEGQGGEKRQNETPENMQSAPPGGVQGQEAKPGARGTAAMDPATRKEVARKGGLAVSRNKQHMAEIGRKGGQSVSKNREHMAKIGRKGGAASRGHRQ
ncbi:MAG: KGG domain-containing protein [Bdellovibrionota bacterium]